MVFYIRINDTTIECTLLLSIYFISILESLRKNESSKGLPPKDDKCLNITISDQIKTLIAKQLI